MGSTRLRVALLWHDTIVFEREVDPRRPVTVGEDPRCTLLIPPLAGVGARHVLFETDGDEIALLPTAQMGGRLTAQGEALEVEAARARYGAEIPVEHGDWGIVDLGAVDAAQSPRGSLALWYQRIEGAAAVPRRPVWAALDGEALGGLTAAVALHFGVLITAFLLWDEAPRLQPLAVTERVAEILMAPPPEPEPEPPVAPAPGPPSDRSPGPVTPEREPADEPAPVADRRKVERAREAGVLNVLNTPGGPLSSVFEDAGFSKRLGDVMGDHGSEVVGAGAHGAGGWMVGAGGGGGGRIQGMGGGGGIGGGGPGGGLGPRRARRPRGKAPPRRAEKPGFCKEADILRVVQARRRGVTYCYERQLAAEPTLQGKVTLAWRIMGDGKVLSAMVLNSTLGNRDVERCMLQTVRRWRFPKPEGGVCQIRFPFVFDPGGP